MNDQLILKNRLKEIRTEKGMSQAGLADKVGISTRYMSKIECGDVATSVSLPILIRIVEELDVDIGQLMAYK